MINRYINILNEIRTGKVDIDNFLYRKAVENEITDDLNAIKRYQILKALQYNLLVKDEFLLVQLFKAEIEMHQNASLQGIDNSLELCAYLLSTYQKPAYVELFLNAKQANFDTECRFDDRYLVSAGIFKTYAFIEQTQPEYARNFYGYVGKSAQECSVTEPQLEHWRKLLQKRYPNYLDKNDKEAEILLAIELNETEILKEKIVAWQNSISSWTKENLKKLAYYKQQSDDTDGQISAKEQLLPFLTTDWDKASALENLAKLYLKINDVDSAWLKLEQTKIFLKKIPDWRRYGLGRSNIECHLDLVISVNNSSHPLANKAYKWAKTEINYMRNLNWSLCKKAITTGNLMHDDKFSEKFKNKLKVKQKQWDDLNA